MPTSFTSLAPVGCSLDQVVSHWALLRPDEAALRWTESGRRKQVTWSELEAMAAAAARELRGTVDVRSPVAVVCADSIDFHVCLIALWRIGAAVLLLDRHWGPAIVEDLLRLIECRCVFSHTGVSLCGSLPRLQWRVYPARLDVAAGFAADTASSASLDGIALFASTSGTTDNPKCVAITHRQIRSAYRACTTVHDFSGVRQCGCLFEVNSLGVLGVCFLLQREYGAGTTLYPAFNFATVVETWNRVLQEDIDFIYLVPPLVRLLNVLPGTPTRTRELRAFCSAAPVTLEELRTLEARHAVRVFNIYGLTELTFAVFFGCRGEDGSASDSIGWPVGIQARLVDDRGEQLEGEASGELEITGPMLTAGYVNNDAATSVTWRDAWLKSGDIARRDGRGRYYIRGRKKDVVFRGGYTYYLHELEHYLRRAPAVVDACAFSGRALPSGEELCVAVQVSEQIDRETLLDWIRVHVGTTKVPNCLYLWDGDLPRNSNGKTQRKLLRDMHLQGAITQ